MKQENYWMLRADTDAKIIGGMTRRVLAYNQELMCVENTFAVGGAAPMHTHAHTQISYVVSGVFTCTVDGETRILHPGDSVLNPSGVPHSCECIEAGILLDMFTPMREDFV